MSNFLFDFFFLICNGADCLHSKKKKRKKDQNTQKIKQHFYSDKTKCRLSRKVLFPFFQATNITKMRHKPHALTFDGIIQINQQKAVSFSSLFVFVKYK